MPVYNVAYTVFGENFTIRVVSENVDEATTLVENMNVVELLSNKTLNDCGGHVSSLTKEGHKPL